MGYNSADKQIYKIVDKEVYCTNYKETIDKRTIKEPVHYCSNAVVRNVNASIPPWWNPCYYIGQLLPNLNAYCANHAFIPVATPQQCSKQSQVNFLELFFTIITIFD